MAPTVSVIIPTYNRAKVLEKTLHVFAELDSEGIAWDVIVVDNNSRDETREVVSSFEGRLPIRYLFEARQGKNWALNQALEHTESELLVFADDDVTPCQHWLQAILASVERWPEHVVFGGRIVPEFPPGTPDFVRQSDFSGYVYGGLDFGPDDRLFPEETTPNGPNCWVRRCVFASGVRYDTSIGPNGHGRISGSELELFTRLRLRRRSRFTYRPRPSFTASSPIKPRFVTCFVGHTRRGEAQYASTAEAIASVRPSLVSHDTTIARPRRA